MSYQQLSQLCAGFVYIYPVISRRSQGLSIGINLHPNHVCNWHCVYCQVPNLSRGKSPQIDLEQLMREFKQCVDTAISLNMSIADVAFAGDGEPTTSPQFLACLDLVIAHLSQLGLFETNLPHHLKLRLITNGSQIEHASVRTALKHLHTVQGEVWFKLDAGSAEEMQAINQVHINIDTHLKHLKQCAERCRTWVQTCVLALHQNNTTTIYPSLTPYLLAVNQVKDLIQGVLIYSVARPSQQSDAVQQVSAATLSEYEKALREAGLEVKSYL